MESPEPTTDPAATEHAVISGFGDQWRRLAQDVLTAEERQALWQGYFRLFPWDRLPPRAEGFDAGCGSGRWAALVAPRVGHLHCLDASATALDVARRNLAHAGNVTFLHARVEGLPLPDASQDFGYSLGVLHHIEDPAAGLRQLVSKLKPGAPLLVYLYYALDNRPRWYQLLWTLSERGRRVISRLPYGLRYATSQAIAAGVYWPLARCAFAGEKLGWRVDDWPLAFYRRRSFYVMRTDALDRFGTRLERRFSRADVERLLQEAGLEDVRVGTEPPFWCAVGFRTGQIPGGFAEPTGSATG